VISLSAQGTAARGRTLLSSTMWTSRAAIREAMTAGEETLRGMQNFCWTDSEFGGSRMRIWSACVRQSVFRVRVNVCSSTWGLNARGSKTARR